MTGDPAESYTVNEDGTVTRSWYDDHDDDETPEIRRDVAKVYYWGEDRQSVFMVHWSDDDPSTNVDRYTRQSDPLPDLVGRWTFTHMYGDAATLGELDPDTLFLPLTDAQRSNLDDGGDVVDGPRPFVAVRCVLRLRRALMIRACYCRHPGTKTRHVIPPATIGRISLGRSSTRHGGQLRASLHRLRPCAGFLQPSQGRVTTRWLSWPPRCRAAPRRQSRYALAARSASLPVTVAESDRQPSADTNFDDKHTFLLLGASCPTYLKEFRTDFPFDSALGLP